jgi:hypothetical protein
MSRTRGRRAAKRQRQCSTSASFHDPLATSSWPREAHIHRSREGDSIGGAASHAYTRSRCQRAIAQRPSQPWMRATARVLQVIEETSGHSRTFAPIFCVFGRFLDLWLSRRNARTFPLSGWPKFRPPPELRPKASGKLGPSGQTSGQRDGQNPGHSPPLL